MSEEEKPNVKVNTVEEPNSFKPDVFTVGALKTIINNLQEEFPEITDESEIIMVMQQPSDDRRLMPVGFGHTQLINADGDVGSGVICIIDLHPLAQVALEQKLQEAANSPKIITPSGVKH